MLSELSTNIYFIHCIKLFSDWPNSFQVTTRFLAFMGARGKTEVNDRTRTIEVKCFLIMDNTKTYSELFKQAGLFINIMHLPCA